MMILLNLPNITHIYDFFNKEMSYDKIGKKSRTIKKTIRLLDYITS